MIWNKNSSIFYVVLLKFLRNENFVPLFTIFGELVTAKLQSNCAAVFPLIHLNAFFSGGRGQHVRFD